MKLIIRLIFIFFLNISLLNADLACCPQSCDKNVKKSFGKLKKEIKKGFKANLKELDNVLQSYNQLTKNENNSTILLNNYLKRLKIKFIEVKKEKFLITKDIKIKAFK